MGLVNVKAMIPFVRTVKEAQKVLDLMREHGLERGVNDLEVIMMCEVPSNVILVDEFAQLFDGFSIGSNDLTQMTWGYSRDDAGKFLNYYLEHKILEKDPTESIDEKGVGFLMDRCVKLGRSVKPKLEIGICGEQGGEPASIKFCDKIGLDYVSLSPYRIPIARVAAAQAALLNKTPGKSKK